MVAEAATTAELARVMAVHRPDVVVLDDGIGAVAVGMINEMSPATDVILVWPGAVMPVGGAARVEPSRVLQDLGPAVESLTGQPCASTSGSGAALLDRRQRSRRAACHVARRRRGGRRRGRRADHRGP